MKDISIYFQPVSIDDNYSEGSLGKTIIQNKENDFPVLERGGVALIEVPEYRNHSSYDSTQHKSSSFRPPLYDLYIGINWKHSFYDLGTLLPGKDIEDTFYALQTVCNYLIKNDIVPFVIGGSQDLSKGLFSAYNSLEQLINITSIDNRLDFEPPHHTITPENWISHVLFQQPNYLFNYANIGSQSHYTSNKTALLFEEMYFDSCRLGTIQQDLRLAEPIMRNTDMLSVDLTSIRASDMQNKNYTSPNGFFANEMCSLLRYAGISDKLSSVGIFNYFSNQHQVTEELVAQLIWYFNEGYANRKGDFPIAAKKEYRKFRVFLQDVQEEIIFFKSNKSARWWIEVPYPGISDSKYLRHQMVPCSFQTYKEAMKGEVPDLWWKTYQKFT